jgi:hypothetical protein
MKQRKAAKKKHATPPTSNSARNFTVPPKIDKSSSSL